MGSIIHAGHMLRKVMAEKGTVCQTIAGNWTECFSALLASIHRGKGGLKRWHMITSPEAAQSSDHHRHGIVSWCRFSYHMADKLKAKPVEKIFLSSVSLSLFRSLHLHHVSTSLQQTIKLYALNLHIEVRQLFLNQTGKKTNLLSGVPFWWEETSFSHTRYFSLKFIHALSLHTPKALGFRQ